MLEHKCSWSVWISHRGLREPERFSSATSHLLEICAFERVSQVHDQIWKCFAGSKSSGERRQAFCEALEWNYHCILTVTQWNTYDHWNSCRKGNQSSEWFPNWREATQQWAEPDFKYRPLYFQSSQIWIVWRKFGKVFSPLLLKLALGKSFNPGERSMGRYCWAHLLWKILSARFQ